jgi:DNA-binding CsgD family transcriptional regulator
MTNAEKRTHRIATWPGRTSMEIAEAEGISVQVVCGAARKLGIQLALRAHQLAAKWPAAAEVVAWQGKTRLDLLKADLRQSDLAKLCRVSTSLVEAWLAPVAASWHRTPSYVEKRGVASIIAGYLPASCSGGERKSRLTRWIGRTADEIADAEGLSLFAVYHYARTHGIALVKKPIGRPRKSYPSHQNAPPMNPPNAKDLA